MDAYAHACTCMHTGKIAWEGRKDKSLIDYINSELGSGYEGLGRLLLLLLKVYACIRACVCVHACRQALHCIYVMHGMAFTFHTYLFLHPLKADSEPKDEPEPEPKPEPKPEPEPEPNPNPNPLP